MNREKKKLNPNIKSQMWSIMFDFESSFTAISGLQVLYVNGDRIPWEPLTLTLIYHYYSCLSCLVCEKIKFHRKTFCKSNQSEVLSQDKKFLFLPETVYSLEIWNWTSCYGGRWLTWEIIKTSKADYNILPKTSLIGKYIIIIYDTKINEPESCWQIDSWVLRSCIFTLFDESVER